jgi:hypothetical protein
MARPQLPSLLDHAKPECSIAVEAISSVAEEIAFLSVRNYEETGIDPTYGYNPDWGQYLSYELTDSCVVVTLRYNEVLVGYCIYLIGPFKHNKNILYADLDAIWISPAFRSGYNAVKMLKLGEEYLAGKVSFIMATSSNKHPIGPILKRMLHYKEVEVLYWKALDNGKQESSDSTG